MKYNLFISHSWRYSNSYDRLTDLLTERPYFEYADYSVPYTNPLNIVNKAHYKAELRNKIENKMRCCNVILILAGVYATYSDSINMEIEIAKELNKPIIAIQPWGSERTSTVVRNNADELVNWNTSSVIDAIRRLSR